MKQILLILLILFLLSCDKQKPKTFYYPNKIEFLKLSKNNPKLDISYFDNFEKLIDTIEKLNDSGNKPIFTLKKEGSEFNFISSTFFGKSFSAPRIKFFNIISISKDSIRKGDYLYPIDSLKLILRKDFLNYGKDNKFSSAPDKLIISITEEKSHLESLLIRVFENFNEIQSETKDSLNLNLSFNRRLGILPPTPLDNFKIVDIN